MSKKPTLILIGICAVSVLLRLATAWYLGEAIPPASDELSYHTLGARLAAGFGYTFPEGWYPFTPPDTPTSHWSFLFSAYVGGIYKLVGVQPMVVRIVGAVLGGILLPWMVYRLARRATGRESIALIAAGCSAVYAYFVLFAAQFMTETFYISALLWSLERGLAIMQRWENGRSISWGLTLSFGVSIGIATLMRQSILPWLVVLFAWLLWTGFRHGKLTEALVRLFVAGSLLLAFILPFTVRNYLVYDDFMLLNSNAGFAMYSAQHPMHGTRFQEYTAAPLPRDLEPLPQNEAQWDKALMKVGMGFIMDEPLRYLQLSASRLVDYFLFWPTAGTSTVNNLGRVLSFGLFLPLMVYGLWLSRHQWRELRLLLGFMLFYTVLHLFTWSMVRYRLPVDAVLLIFAAGAIQELARRFWPARQPSATAATRANV